MLPISLKHFGLLLGAALLVNAPVHAQSMEADNVDNKSAVVFAYFAIGDDENPSASLREEQFAQQIEEIMRGGYTVKPLTDIVAAFDKGKALPPRTIAITFDGADNSILTYAVPLLEKYELPFTVFVPADRVSSGKPPFMTWDELRGLKKTGLVNFGLHPSSYAHLVDGGAEDIKRQINSSLSDIRKELDVNPVLFSYPFGEYDDEYKKVVKQMGFKAAFGQQSGVAYAGGDEYALPRFTLTERYGDMDRFLMTANALPLPIKDLSPVNPYLSTLTPSIGFTAPDALVKSLKSLSCFSSGEEKPDIQVLGARVEIRLEKPLDEDRLRINCTLPVAGADGEEPRFRWFGMMYSVPDKLLGENAQPTESVQARQIATDNGGDFISLE